MTPSGEGNKILAVFGGGDFSHSLGRERFLAGTSPVKGGAGVALGTAAAALGKFAKNGIDG